MRELIVVVVVVVVGVVGDGNGGGVRKIGRHNCSCQPARTCRFQASKIESRFPLDKLARRAGSIWARIAIASR